MKRLYRSCLSTIHQESEQEDDQEVENYTIKIVNLKKRTDRREKMETKFKNVHSNKYDFFEAVSYKSEEAKNMMNSNIVKKFPNTKRDKIRINNTNKFILDCIQKNFGGQIYPNKTYATEKIIKRNA